MPYLVYTFSAAGEMFTFNINLDALKAIDAEAMLLLLQYSLGNRKHF